DAAELRPAVERMVRDILERSAALLEARMPGRIVLIRRLPLHWRFDESILEDREQGAELARSVAEEIERSAYPLSVSPPANWDGPVIFEDESHLLASHLLACADGGPAWFHQGIEDWAAGDPVNILAAPERRATAFASLIRLARAGVLAPVLAKLPAGAVAKLAAALGAGRPL